MRGYRTNDHDFTRPRKTVEYRVESKSPTWDYSTHRKTTEWRIQHFEQTYSSLKEAMAGAKDLLARSWEPLNWRDEILETRVVKVTTVERLMKTKPPGG